MSAVLLCQGTALALPLRDASVHCCCTSPPYWQLRSYGIGVHHGELGLEATIDAYVKTMAQVFREVRRVLHPTGTLWLNVGTTYQDGQDLGIPWRLAFALKDDGWRLRSEIIFHKVNPMPESVQTRPTRSHEQVFLFSKQGKYYYDATAVAEPSAYPVPASRLPSGTYSAMSGRNDGGLHRSGGFVTDATRACRSVWSLASEPLVGFQHYAAFPQALVRRCLLAGAPTAVCSACQSPSCSCLEYSCTTCGFVLESSYAITKRYMHQMRKGLSESQARPEILQQDVLCPETGAITGPQLPPMREALSSERERYLSLQQTLCVQDDSAKPPVNEGMVSRSERVYPDLSARTSQCIEGGICHGAQASHGTSPRQATPSDRSGTPQEQRQSRQPPRKPRSDGKKSPRQHEAANIHSHVSALSCDVSHPRPCPRCPGEVSLHPPPTKPSTVLDIFCGSGTTLLVARELGHHAIGLDLSYPYLHDIARTRLGLAQLAAWTGDAPAPAPAVIYDDLPLFGGF